MKTVPIYGHPLLRYRRQVPDTPNATIYRDLGGLDLSSYNLNQPFRRAVTLRFYDTQDILQAVVSSNAQYCPILALKWDDLDSGSGSFDLELATDLGLARGWRLDIHLWNNQAPAYSGFIQQKPTAGSTDRTFKYGGYGGLALLDRVFVTATYPAQPVSSIANQLARLAEQRVRIQVFDSQIASSSYSTLGDLKFLRTPVKQALEQCAQLAGGYEWGIDANRRFFFRPAPTETDWHGWVGKHLETFVPEEDSSKIANRIYIKGGKVRGDLAADHPLYKTNWLEDVIEDTDSQALYGVCEDDFSAPATLNLIDALRAADQELKRRAYPRAYARVDGLEFAGTPLSTSGKARIVGQSGQQLILPKKRLRYRLAKGGVTVDADFGDIDFSASNTVANLVANAAAEALSRQNSQRQL